MERWELTYVCGASIYHTRSGAGVDCYYYSLCVSNYYSALRFYPKSRFSILTKFYKKNAKFTCLKILEYILWRIVE